MWSKQIIEQGEHTQFLKFSCHCKIAVLKLVKNEEILTENHTSVSCDKFWLLCAKKEIEYNYYVPKKK